MKLNKSFKIILLILILIILFLIIRSTYSKYISTQDTGTNFHISKWNIVLNDKLISENKDFSQDIQIIYDENPENIVENVIVPTSKGHFEVTLESTGTELPFEYIFTLKSEEELDNDIDDFKIVSYSLNDAPEIKLTEGAFEIAGKIFPLKDGSGNFTGGEVKNKFVFYVEWIDDDTNLLNNQDDVSASKDKNISGLIPIKLNVRQIIIPIQ